MVPVPSYSPTSRSGQGVSERTVTALTSPASLTGVRDGASAIRRVPGTDSDHARSWWARWTSSGSVSSCTPLRRLARTPCAAEATDLTTARQRCDISIGEPARLTPRGRRARATVSRRAGGPRRGSGDRGARAAGSGPSESPPGRGDPHCSPVLARVRRRCTSQPAYADRAVPIRRLPFEPGSRRTFQRRSPIRPASLASVGWRHWHGRPQPVGSPCPR
jgi:hypothetical protein